MGVSPGRGNDGEVDRSGAPSSCKRPEQVRADRSMFGVDQPDSRRRRRSYETELAARPSSAGGLVHPGRHRTGSISKRRRARDPPHPAKGSFMIVHRGLDRAHPRIDEDPGRFQMQITAQVQPPHLFRAQAFFCSSSVIRSETITPTTPAAAIRG